jgi:hypothetical protein
MYHITTYEAAKSIIDDGFIDPSHSQGKNNVCWYVTRHRVTWAMAHVCKRHNCGIDVLAVLTISTTGLNMLRTNRKGIYASAYKIEVLEMTSATMWLGREEQYVQIPRGQRRRPTTWFEDYEGTPSLPRMRRK